MANTESPRYALLVAPDSPGSNLIAVHKAMPERVAVVVADRRDAQPFGYAHEHNLETRVAKFRGLNIANGDEYRVEDSANLANMLNGEGINVAVMVGFNRLLKDSYFDIFKNPTINLHPGAIPDDPLVPFVFEGVEYPWNQGKMKNDAMKNFLGLPYAISSIHIATKIPDFGPVLKRVFEPTRPDDDVDSLYARVKLKEHEGLVSVLFDYYS